MLLALRKLRKEWWQWQPPRLPGWIALCGAPFALYLLLDAFFFHNRLYTLEVAAEPAFPWALTILMCWGVWCVLQQYTSLPSGCYVVLYLPFLFYAPFETLADRGDVRTYHSFSRVEPGRPYTAYYWIDACHWISENTPKTAKFWVPKEGTTFKWHSRRSDVGTWKDVPQDAAGLLRWREMMRDLHWYRGEDGLFREDRSLTVLLWWKKPEEIEQLRKEHGFDHILCAKSPELPHLGNLETIYENEVYRVLRIKKPSE